MLTTKDFLSTLGLFLKQKRTDAEITQQQVANEMGYSSPQFISNWERGLIAPPLSTIRQLVSLYRCNAEEVYEFIANEQLKILRRELLGNKKSAVKLG